MLSPGHLLARAALAQVLAWTAVFAAIALGLRPGLAGLPLVGLLAAGLAALCGLPRWWWVIEAVFPLALGLAWSSALPATVWAAALLLCLLLFGAVFRSRVPLWLSGRAARDCLLRQLPPRAGLHVLDLGGGFGGVLLALARQRPDAHLVGVEWALLPWLGGRLRLWFAGYRGVWRWASLWKCDLGDYDVVYAYLSPAAMPALWQKARAEMRPGALLFSYRFAIPEVPALSSWAVSADPDDRLWAWQPGGPATGG